MSKPSMIEVDLTQIQSEIIDGSLLGDGSITFTSSGKAVFSKKQKLSRREYLDWHCENIKPFSCKIYECDVKLNDKIYKQAFYYTKASMKFAELRNKWYPNGVKIVPSDISLTPLSLSIWYFDDGSN